ncbi:MAG: VanZ family protein [Marinicaulis sp.]|nr:VanZ family protein [Marinicaulis sp.]
MDVFSSNRERRLWVFFLVVVVAIYSTLATATRLTGMLREYGLLEISFAIGALTVGLMVILHSLKSVPNRAGFAIAVGMIAVYVLVFVRMATPEERTHLVEYGVVAILAFEALSERCRNGRRVPMPAMIAILLASAIGVLDELIQSVLPNRVFDWRDILFNVLTAIMAIFSTIALSWTRRRKLASDRG